MLLSMTGFGRAVRTVDSKQYTVEIRSLNSKYTDLRLKIPSNFKEKEYELRKLISDHAQRGKVDVTIEIKSMKGDSEYGINAPLFRRYFSELEKLIGDLGVDRGDLVQTIMRIPNVVTTEEDAIDEEEWGTVRSVVEEAMEQFSAFRRSEGDALENDLRLRIENIKNLHEQVDPFEKGRVDRLRSRLSQNLEEYMGKDNVDENRFEQEVLFYLEKIDITEEKVRLDQHCKFFLEQLDSKKTAVKGRKLSFIGQEIGREINTLGAKAYSSDIQRLVVGMKDELEKIKEQVANIV
jgi:uncharacterized protein (TIGR00255 family)